MPPVCKFYLRGCCKFGSGCKFDHPGEQTSEIKGFSFNAALNQTTANSFSFTRALELTQTEQNHDIDMTDMTFFRSQPSIFQPQPVFQNNNLATFGKQIETYQPTQSSYPTLSNISQTNAEPIVELDYSQSERLAYSNPDFEFRKIPIKPPPHNGR